jgi:inner membrane transporter RhtA
VRSSAPPGSGSRRSGPPRSEPGQRAIELARRRLALLELEALRKLPEAVFGVLMSLDPAVAALAGFVVLGQDLGARELVAIAMVIVASAGAAGLSHRSDVP